MIEDMQLRGLSEITQDRYVRAVRQLAEHYGKSPAKIAEEDLGRYFLTIVESTAGQKRSICWLRNSELLSEWISHSGWGCYLGPVGGAVVVKALILRVRPDVLPWRGG